MGGVGTWDSAIMRKIITQNQKYKCINNVKLIYLTSIPSTCKFEKHKQSNAHEKHKQSFPSENYNVNIFTAKGTNKQITELN